MEAHFEKDVESFNVVGDIRGSEFPNEIVLVGGHFDSWDAATGASDDAVGCVVTWEAARLMKKLGIRPKRTVRVVLFTNEENGTRGGNGYRDAHATEAGNHILALESDSGVFAPARLGFSGSEAARKMIADIGIMLAPLGMQEILLAAVMLLVLILRPSGLMGGREIPWPFGRPQILRPVTARAICWIIAGHTRHHLEILAERYGVKY